MTHRVSGPGRARLAGLPVTAVVVILVALGAVGVLISVLSGGPATPSGGPSASGGPPGGGHHRSSDPRSAPGGSPSPSGSPAPGGAGDAAALIPSRGAYLGAYVQPSVYTTSGEVAAFRAFERSVGGPLELVHTYHHWADPFPDTADRYFLRSGKVLLLTWSGNPDTRKIIAGDYDAMIRARARALKRLGRPILLEFRHEMDRPNLQWAVHGPKNYIAAWDHVRAIFSQVGATNVGWVWCPTGYGFDQGRAQAFYPGNNEVDWVCADVYAPTTAHSLQEEAHSFLTWARHTGKPVLIGEFGVGGSNLDWPFWLLAAGELVKNNPQIKGLAYFDADGIDSQGRPFQYSLGGDPAALQIFAKMRGWAAFHPVTRATP